MKWLGRLILHTLAILIAAYLVPGVRVDGIFTALVVAVSLGIANAVLKPILVLLTLPITLLTLGLFTFVINALLVLLVNMLVAGFQVDGFFTAFLFSIVLSLVSWFLQLLVRDS